MVVDPPDAVSVVSEPAVVPIVAVNPYVAPKVVREGENCILNIK